MNGVGLFRTFIFREQPEDKLDSRRYLLYIFLGLFIGLGMFAWEGWYSVLPIAAMVIETTGLWMKRPAVIRIINIFPHPCWFIYNFIVGSYPGMATEIFVIASIFIGIIRLDILKRKPGSQLM